MIYDTLGIQIGTEWVWDMIYRMESTHLTGSDGNDTINGRHVLGQPHAAGRRRQRHAARRHRPRHDSMADRATTRSPAAWATTSSPAAKACAIS